jgi:uncharacterized protein
MSMSAPGFNKAAQAGILQDDVNDFVKLAAVSSKVAVSSRIAEHGPGIVTRMDSAGRTPMTAAAETGHKEVMDLLIDAGAGINAPDAKGNTPLIIAVRHNQVATVNFLLERGANINATNNDGQSALMLAVTHRNSSGTRGPTTMPRRKTEIIRALIERDARFDIEDAKGYTAESWARRQGYRALAEMLVREAESRRQLREADIAVFSDGLPQNITVHRIRYKDKGPG